VKRVAGATFEAMIWHRAEQYVGAEESEDGEMLVQLIRKPRSDAGAANLPYVAAMLPDMSP